MFKFIGRFWRQRIKHWYEIRYTGKVQRISPNGDIHIKDLPDQPEYLDEIVGHGSFHLESMGRNNWFLQLDGAMVRFYGKIIEIEKS